MNKINQFLCKYVGSVGQSLNKVAQVGHMLAGALLPLAFKMFVPTEYAGLYGFIGIIVIWGLPKEFYVDIMCEKASYGDGLNDWLHYLYGALASYIGLAIKFHSVWI